MMAQAPEEAYLVQVAAALRLYLVKGMKRRWEQKVGANTKAVEQLMTWLLGL